MQIKFLLTLFTFMLLSASTPFSAPTTFPQVIGNALLCNDHIDPSYFKSYMSAFFQPPYKVEGDAYWFKAETTLFGGSVKEVFVSVESSKFAFIGIVMEDKQETVKARIESLMGIRFRPAQDVLTLRSAPGSFLIQYGSQNSKLFCVKHRIDGVA